jgi:transposase
MPITAPARSATTQFWPYWARELTRLGHDARLMPPHYVKA